MKHRQLIPPFLVGLIASFVLGACAGVPLALTTNVSSNAATPATHITVSAAASLQESLEAIAPQFHAAHPKIAIDYNFGASGALQQQIQQGAPADVFFSAASQQMNALAEKDLILPNSRQNIVANELVLIAPLNSSVEIAALNQLKNADIHSDIKRFAVGEFRSVPAGQYAEQAFKEFDLLSALRSKFIFGNNVRTVLSAVESGNADLGMVYKTDAALSDRIMVLATVPASSHDSIDYPIAIMQGSADSDAAQTFIDFLTTEAAQQVFEDFGFRRS